MEQFVKYIIGVFLILHGLVHLLYLGHSRRLYELVPDFTWPDHSWLLSKPFSNQAIRSAANIACVIITTGFCLAGIRFMLGNGWLYPEIVISAILSILLFVIFWDGRMVKLDNQGGYAILINIVILITVFIKA